MQICIHTDNKKYKIKDEPLKLLSKESWNSPITHKTKNHPNALGGHIWDDDEIIYWKQESDYNFISKSKQKKLTKLAFLEASFQTPLKIRERRKSTADAQIRVNWFDETAEPYFKRNQGVLAFAYGPGRGIGGDITMNASKLWLLRKGRLTMKEAFEKGYIDESQYDKAHPNNTIRYYDPLHTLKHEGGHAIGMNHIDSPIERRWDTIMYPFYNGLRKFGNFDLDYLYDLYGKASINKKIADILLLRIDLFS